MTPQPTELGQPTMTVTMTNPPTTLTTPDHLGTVHQVHITEQHNRRPPYVGDMVRYRLSDQDVNSINANDPARYHRNAVATGQVCAAVVVAVFSPDRVNLTVLLDGEMTYWATSREYGLDPGHWVPHLPAA